MVKKNYFYIHRRKYSSEDYEKDTRLSVTFYPNHKIWEKKKNCNLLLRQFKSSSLQAQ